MAEEDYGDEGKILGNVDGHIERGLFSRKNLNRAIRSVVPSRFKISDENFNNNWDKIYSPLSNGSNPNSFQVGARLLKRNSQLDINRVKRLRSRILDVASKIGDAIPKSTASLIERDLSQSNSSEERESLLSSEHGLDTPSDKKAKVRMPRIFHRGPQGLGR